MVSITFDDGYLDNAEVAAPCLDRHGLRATYFVSTGFVDGAPMWFDEASVAFRRLGGLRCARELPPESPANDLGSFLGALKSLGESERRAAVAALRAESGPLEEGLLFAPLAPGDVARLHTAGHEIGSHSVTHPLLPGLARDRLQSELAVSRARIAEWTGALPGGFCYPNGDSDVEVRASVVASGYAYACTTARGANREGVDLLLLRRRMIAEASTTTPGGKASDCMFAGEVFGLHSALRGVAGVVRGRARAYDT
jgi:peptidoglycan/xylan/chitin deacetylase (PgdA/CDA1 family)